MAINYFVKAAFIWCVLAVLFCSTGFSAEADILIIANKTVQADTLAKSEIKNIFLGVTTFWPDNSKINFATLGKSDTHAQFTKEYTRKSTSQFRAYWRNQLFIGKGKIPKAFQTEQEMVDFVASTDGAIGYVSSSAANETVKVITVSDN